MILTFATLVITLVAAGTFGAPVGKLNDDDLQLVNAVLPVIAAAQGKGEETAGNVLVVVEDRSDVDAGHGRDELAREHKRSEAIRKGEWTWYDQKVALVVALAVFITVLVVFIIVVFCVTICAEEDNKRLSRMRRQPKQVVHVRSCDRRPQPAPRSRSTSTDRASVEIRSAVMTNTTVTTNIHNAYFLGLIARILAVPQVREIIESRNHRTEVAQRQ